MTIEVLADPTAPKAPWFTPASVSNNVRSGEVLDGQEELAMPAGVYGRRPAEERFWAKVRKTDGCWLWTGTRNKQGRGSLYAEIPGERGPRVVASRYSWFLHNGSIPNGLLVLHKCDNPPCVRPDHLELGTYSKNSIDAYARGLSKPRRLFGESNPHATLTNAERSEILSLRRAGGSVTVIARKFGINRNTVYKIRKLTGGRR